jgi:hypothetical protein
MVSDGQDRRKWDKLKTHTVFLVGSLQGKRLVLSLVLQKQKVMDYGCMGVTELVPDKNNPLRFLCCLKPAYTIPEVQFLPDRKCCFFQTNANRLMQCKEVFPAYYEIIRNP